MQIGISEIDAQILHFSQRNYQIPFSGLTINLCVLGEADAESILEDIGGWLAGNENPFLKKYQLNLTDIKNWIEQAGLMKLNFASFSVRIDFLMELGCRLFYDKRGDMFVFWSAIRLTLVKFYFPLFNFLFSINQSSKYIKSGLPKWL